RLAATLGYRYTILTNRPASCPTGVPRCFEADIAIAVPKGAPSLPVEIRYSLVNPVLKIDSDTFDNRTINGDLNVLTLKPGQSLKPGQTYHVKLTGLGAFFSRNHMMPNATLAVAGLAPRVIAATRTGTEAETGLETLPFVAPMTDEAALARSAPDDQTVWRTPERAFKLYAQRGATPVDVAILPKP
ncbi:carbohydate-binding domain-containing protein, partial [Staphylococcus aureus]|nr:carbohydate-binding domain-containing protein [Staphylococcus aureus]